MSEQRRTITLDFHIEQEVTIKGIPGKIGVVLAALFDGGVSIQYLVRYISEEDAKEVYFYAWELEASE